MSGAKSSSACSARRSSSPPAVRFDDAGSEALGVCLFDEGWHQGVVGLVAGRLKDRLHRPVIAFARADGGSLRGSARSVDGIHIRDVLDGIATRHPGLIEKFGGHAMAAGMSLPEANLERIPRRFRRRSGGARRARSPARRHSQRRRIAPGRDVHSDRARAEARRAVGPGISRSRFSTAASSSPTLASSAAST